MPANLLLPSYLMSSVEDITDYTIGFNPDVVMQDYPTALNLARVGFTVLVILFTVCISLKFIVGEGEYI